MARSKDPRHPWNPRPGVSFAERDPEPSEPVTEAERAWRRRRRRAVEELEERRRLARELGIDPKEVRL